VTLAGVPGGTLTVRHGAVPDDMTGPQLYRSAGFMVSNLRYILVIFTPMIQMCVATDSLPVSQIPAALQSKQNCLTGVSRIDFCLRNESNPGEVESCSEAISCAGKVTCAFLLDVNIFECEHKSSRYVYSVSVLSYGDL
jgi:hypothetical protein